MPPASDSYDVPAIPPIEQPANSRRSASGFGFLALAVFLTFGTRFVLSGWNSYWLDELYSVEIYALHHDSVIDAVRHLAETSIHPPLYQGILYYWVQLFGDGEVATRTLSNITMTLGVIFAHRFADRAFGRFVANTSALMLSLTYLVMYYGLETRSYGVSFMFSTLSTLAILAYLDPELRLAGSWRYRGVLPWGLILIGANVALMLTHYYNFFFWASQALFAGIYLICFSPHRRRFREFATVTLLYVAQLLAFAAVWGRVTWNAYTSNSGRFQTESVTFTPLEILDSVTVRSLNFGPIGLWSLGLVAVVLASIVVSGWSKRDQPETGRKLLGVLYLATITIGPAAMAYLAFQITRAERLNARYVLYLLPGIVVLLTLSIVEVLRRFATRWSARSQTDLSRLKRYSVVASIALTLVFVGPGAIRASRSVKDDWRNMAQDMVSIAESDPGSDYLVLEPAFRTTPVFDYYLRRYSDNLRVTATIRRSEETRGSGFSFERLSEVLEQSDFIIIPFVHHRTTNFPIALKLLKEKYEVEHWQIDDDNKGLVIFAVDPAS